MTKSAAEILAESIADRTGHGCLCDEPACRDRRNYRAREVINDLRLAGFQIKRVAKAGTKVRQSTSNRRRTQ